MHVHNTEARSRNHCYRGKTVRICNTYSDYVSVALIIQRAMRMRRIILSYGLSDCIVFSHIISLTAQFSKKKFIEPPNVCFDFIINIHLKYNHFSLCDSVNTTI